MAGRCWVGVVEDALYRRTPLAPSGAGPRMSVAPPACLLQLLGRGQTPRRRVSVPNRRAYGTTVKVTVNGVPIGAPAALRGVAVMLCAPWFKTIAL